MAKAKAANLDKLRMKNLPPTHYQRNSKRLQSLQRFMAVASALERRSHAGPKLETNSCHGSRCEQLTREVVVVNATSGWDGCNCHKQATRCGATTAPHSVHASLPNVPEVNSHTPSNQGVLFTRSLWSAPRAQDAGASGRPTNVINTHTDRPAWPPSPLPKALLVGSRSSPNAM